MTNEAAERPSYLQSCPTCGYEWELDSQRDADRHWALWQKALAAERLAGAAGERERADLLEAGLMVNMNIRQSETLTWARRLIEADARVIKPWLTSPEAFLDAEAAR